MILNDHDLDDYDCEVYCCEFDDCDDPESNRFQLFHVALHIHHLKKTYTTWEARTQKYWNRQKNQIWLESS